MWKNKYRQEALEPPSDHLSGEKRATLREARFIFFGMLLFAAFIALYALVAFFYNDIPTATWLALSGMATLVGVITQMVMGLSGWLRFYYGCCGTFIFMSVVLSGEIEHMALFGALGMVPGFVIILGWRLGLVFLAILALFCSVVFYGDYYLDSSTAFTPMVEIKFYVTFTGLSVLMLAYGYHQQRTVSELIADNGRVNALAYKDPLTGLPNRRALEDVLVQRWEEYRRSGHRFAVLLCNIDDFKSINDQYGHDFGDGVLLRLSNVLTRTVRSQDVICRWGGDEFLVIMPGLTQTSGLKVAERILRRVAEVELTMLDQAVRVTMSIGVSSVVEALDSEDIITIADNGLFQAKHTGKNRAVIG